MTHKAMSSLPHFDLTMVGISGSSFKDRSSEDISKFEMNCILIKVISFSVLLMHLVKQNMI